MILIAYVYKYNPTYRVTLTANPTRETKHQIGMALLCTLTTPVPPCSSCYE